MLFSRAQLLTDRTGGLPLEIRKATASPLNAGLICAEACPARDFPQLLSSKNFPVFLLTGVRQIEATSVKNRAEEGAGHPVARRDSATTASKIATKSADTE
jgi:hypothetical protein